MRGVGEEGWAGAISFPYLQTLDGDRPVLVPHGGLDALRAGPRPAAALDVVCRPSATGALRLVDDGTPGATLRRDGDRITVDPGTSVTAEMPWVGERLRVIVDRPLLEVAGDVEWWSLGR